MLDDRPPVAHESGMAAAGDVGGQGEGLENCPLTNRPNYDKMGHRFLLGQTLGHPAGRLLFAP